MLLDLVVQVLRAGAVRFHPDGLDAHVGAAAAGALLQLGDDAVLGVVQGVRADVLSDLRKALGEPVDDDDLLGAEQHRAAGGHLPDAAGAPDRDGVAGGDAGEVGAGPAGRGGVGGEQRRQVRHPVRDGERTLVGVRHSDVLGVTAGEPAQHVAVGEAAADRDPHMVSVNAGLGLPLSHSGGSPTTA